MRLSEQAIKEFAAIYEKEFGETISLEKAELLAERLLALLSMVSHPPDRDEGPS